MKLYVANVSQQHQIIWYRLDILSDGNRDSRLVIPPKQSPAIPPGRQLPLGGDLHEQQLAALVAQITRYGAIEEAEIRNYRGQKLAYVWNADRPVSPETIRLANDYNKGIKIADGAARRKKAAVAASEIVQNTVDNMTPAGAPEAPMREFDISVEQDEQSPMGERPITEGLKVAVGETAPGQPPVGGRRGGRRSRAA